MDYLPIFAQIKNRLVLMVGGGTVALRKIHLLLSAGAVVHVVSKQLHPELTEKLSADLIWIADDFSAFKTAEALFPYYLIYSATNDSALNACVQECAERAHKFVNVVDDMDKCSFITPSIIDRSPLMIAVSSSGKTPVLTRLIREKLEKTLSFDLGKIAHIAGEYRDQVREKIKDVVQRRRFWENIFESPFCQHIENKQPQLACDYLDNEINNIATGALKKHSGQVILVGAGPGDPALLTIKALNAMQKADIVLYDYLVSNEILALVRRDARLICVGKRAGNHSMPQSEINQLLVKHALEGKTVIRLKGGDPFIFGRGAEELLATKTHNIPFQIIPGITAATGACAYAGIPLTHRDYAQSVSFMTAHCRSDGHPINWHSLANSEQTICIYMGALKAEEISHQLIKHGLPANTPSAVISNGTHFDQTVSVGVLSQLADLVKKNKAPILIVIGKVVNFHDELEWFN